MYYQKLDKGREEGKHELTVRSQKMQKTGDGKRLDQRPRVVASSPSCKWTMQAPVAAISSR